LPCKKEASQFLCYDTFHLTWFMSIKCIISFIRTVLKSRLCCFYRVVCW